MRLNRLSSDLAGVQTGPVKVQLHDQGRGRVYDLHKVQLVQRVMPDQIPGSHVSPFDRAYELEIRAELITANGIDETIAPTRFDTEPPRLVSDLTQFTSYMYELMDRRCSSPNFANVVDIPESPDRFPCLVIPIFAAYRTHSGIAMQFSFHFIYPEDLADLQAACDQAGIRCM
jgi:hypothetical protein